MDSGEIPLGLRLRNTQNQTCDLPASLKTNLPCRPDCVVCLGLCVTSSIPYTPLSCSLSSTSVYTLQCQHRLSAMATHTATRRSEHGPLLPPGFFTTGFREKGSENILKLCPTVRKKYAFEVGSQLVFYVTAGVGTG